MIWIPTDGAAIRSRVTHKEIEMAFTQAQIDAIDVKIAALEASSFSIGSLSVDQQKTLQTLKEQRAFMANNLTGTLSCGAGQIRGVDAE